MLWWGRDSGDRGAGCFQQPQCPVKVTGGTLSVNDEAQLGTSFVELAGGTFTFADVITPRILVRRVVPFKNGVVDPNYDWTTYWDRYHESIAAFKRIYPVADVDLAVGPNVWEGNQLLEPDGYIYFDKAFEGRAEIDRVFRAVNEATDTCNCCAERFHYFYNFLRGKTCCNHILYNENFIILA